MLVLASDRIDLEKVDLREAPPALALLDHDEQRHAAGFLRAADRHRFVTAHTALRHVLARASGLTPTELRLATHPGGKPWPPELPWLEFNLSHAGEVALIALARSIRLGVDVELLARGTDWHGIARHYFSPGERRAIGQGEGAARRFYTLWTAKEAVLKAVGSGLDGLREVVIALDTDERPRLLGDALGAWNLHSMPALGDPSALAHDGPPRALRHWHWRSPNKIVPIWGPT